MDISTDELFERFLEETDILNDNNSQVVILFGSRITDNYTNNSDLDIFIIIPEDKGYFNRTSRLVDGVSVETMEMSEKAFRRLFATEIMNYESFYKSIFTFGIVKKDNIGLVEKVRNIIKNYKPDVHRTFKIDSSWIKEIDELYYSYREATNNKKKYCYYKLVEYLKLMYMFMNSYTELPASITYNLFSDEDKRDKYLCELPNRDFIDVFVQAIKPKDMDDSLSELFKLAHYEDYLVSGRNVNVTKRRQRISLFDDERDKMMNLLFLAKYVEKVQNKLINFSYDSDYIYFDFLSFSYDKFLETSYIDEKEFESILNDAIDADDIDSRIKYTEELFHLFNKDKRFDYSDYSL